MRLGRNLLLEMLPYDLLQHIAAHLWRVDPRDAARFGEACGDAAAATRAARLPLLVLSVRRSFGSGGGIRRWVLPAKLKPCCATDASMMLQSVKGSASVVCRLQTATAAADEEEAATICTASKVQPEAFRHWVMADAFGACSDSYIFFEALDASGRTARHYRPRVTSAFFPNGFSGQKTHECWILFGEPNQGVCCIVEFDALGGGSDRLRLGAPRIRSVAMRVPKSDACC